MKISRHIAKINLRTASLLREFNKLRIDNHIQASGPADRALIDVIIKIAELRKELLRTS
jgi:hypothetical protein